MSTGNGGPAPLGLGGGGGGGGSKTYSSATSNSRSSDAPKLRPYSQVVAEEKAHRNILEIKLRKIIPSDEDTARPKNLTTEDVSTLFFDIIKINPFDCVGVALSTHRYDTREIKLKANIDADKYVTDSPILFKEHEIHVKKQTASMTRVMFKNVPLNVPDEEILHLCSFYGKPIGNTVSYDKASKATRGLPGSTRYINMNMARGMQLENYYFLEGPLEGDRGARITVLHNNQIPQCSHCLRRQSNCRGAGNGLMCKNAGTVQASVSDYKTHLKVHLGYTSLKTRYYEEEYPNLLGKPEGASYGGGHMQDEESFDAEDEEVEENIVETNKRILKNRMEAEKKAELEEKEEAERNILEEKEKSKNKIEELEEKLRDMERKLEQGEATNLKEAEEKIKASIYEEYSRDFAAEEKKWQKKTHELEQKIKWAEEKSKDEAKTREDLGNQIKEKTLAIIGHENKTIELQRKLESSYTSIMFQGSYGYGNGYVSENVDIPCDPLATSPEIMRIDHVDAGLPSNAEPMSSNVPSNYPSGNIRPVDQDSQESCSTRDMSENGNDMPERANDMTENGNESVPEKPASPENVKSYQINVDVGLSSNAAPGPSVEPVEPGKPASVETVKNDQKNADAGLSSNAAPAPGDIQENKEQAKELPGSTGKSKNMSVVINKNHTVHVKLDNFTYDSITDTIIVKNEKEFYQELQLGAGDTQLKTRAKKIKELRKKH